MNRKLILLIAVLYAASALCARSQTGPRDSLVSLLSAKSMELIEKDGVSYRKVTGPARFFHNNTYLICDTALWHVNTEEIDAIGNVKILQNETVLSGDKLTYYISLDLAQFRGSLVQLEDKDRNTLRTRFLDYNTKDSVAIFQNGGALKDKDGQIIESRTGTYDSKTKVFTFTDNVNMFTDSIFIKTTRLEYNTDLNLATFGSKTDVWKEDNMLSSDAGWYDRNRELFFFNQNVHAMDPEKEGWADSLFFYRNTMDVEMLGQVQVTDSVRNVSAVAGRMEYIDSLSRLTLTRDPAVIGKTDSTGQPSDTVYFGADSLILRTLPKYAIDSSLFKIAASRLDNLSADAVMTYRKKAAEAAKQAAEEAAMRDPNMAAKRAAEAMSGSMKGRGSGGKDEKAGRDAPAPADLAATSDEKIADSPEVAAGNAADSLALPAPAVGSAADSLVTKGLPGVKDSLVGRDSLGIRDSLAVQRDSLALKRDSLALADSLVFGDSLSVKDSLAVADSLAGPKDSTKVNFLTALRNVKLYRDDIQIACDSLEYSDLDSLVRLYKRPLVWNEIKRQYSSDSLFVVIRNNKMEKASLMSEAFIIMQEDSLFYNQIRSAEMLAYFDTTAALTRFDALGDASTVFYLKEDSTYATVNKSEAKMLYAEFRDGEIDRISFFEAIKNDAFPLAQMTKEDRQLKGFEWQPELRPRSRKDITHRGLKPSERTKYSLRPKASYTQTDIYFPGYMNGVYKQIAANEAARQRRAKEKAEREKFLSDSLAAITDSLKVSGVQTADSLVAPRDTLAVQDSTLIKKSADSSVVSVPLDPKAAAKAEKAAARKAARLARQKEKEARWARLDSLDALKVKLAEEKKLAKERAKKRKELEAIRRQQEKDEARLQKHIEKYRRKKARRQKASIPGD